MKGIDVKAISVTVAGHAVGGILFTQVNKIKYLQELPPEKQALKGAIVAAMGYAIIPMLAEKMGKGTGKDLAIAAGQGMGFIGTMILANSVAKPQAGKPALFPTISGVDEENNGMQGVGYCNNNLSGLGGYEQSPIEGFEEDPTLSGLEDIV